jgi:hypothetical protein
MGEIHVDNIFSAFRRRCIDVNFENGTHQTAVAALKGISR